MATRVSSLEERTLLAAAFPEFVDPNPAPGNGFGTQVIPLSTGNVIVTAPADNIGAPGAGAVYLFNGATGALISTLRGSHSSDQIGSGGIVALSNGNFLVLSPKCDNGGVADTGAVTWGSGITGVSGSVSATNSLVGSSNSDQVGSVTPTLLTNGNYVVVSKLWNNNAAGASDAGAVTWGSGTSGVSGVISSSNSLVGTTAFDVVGNDGVTALSNGNYVVGSSLWHNGVNGAGAATWGNGTTGVTGAVSASNSLVGTSTSDNVGASIKALPNGAYVVISTSWDNGANSNAGAVTWGDSTGGVQGTITSANSLIGSHASDQVGSNGVTILSNGNYLVLSPVWNSVSGAATWANGTTGISGIVSAANSLVGAIGDNAAGVAVLLSNGNYLIRSPFWDNGSAVDAGAVTFGNAATGVVGLIGAANSLVGSSSNDSIGSSGSPITLLPDGGYVVRSSSWDNGAAIDAGAVTWGSGTSGVAGVISAANSLVGSNFSDLVGADGVTVLPSGDYLVRSSSWTNGSAFDAGAVTWGSKLTGVKGLISNANSFVGTSTNDRVGSGGVTLLSNGNYVIRSPNWGGGLSNRGAVTWASGAGTSHGDVTFVNSLIGVSSNDQLSSGGITVLSDGDYVVRSPLVDQSGITDVGAVTWANGNGGTVGSVTSSNSLVGSTSGDQVGSSAVTALTNGNYVVASPNWDNGSVVDAGALTWGSGAGGISGVVGPANSLVGTTALDLIGIGGATALSNGNYFTFNVRWDNGPLADAGAVTWGNGVVGVRGPVSAENSIVGSSADDRIGSLGVNLLPNGNFVTGSPTWDNGAANDAGAVIWVDGAVGLNGAVSAANSLVGTTAGDSIGSVGSFTVLTNGNYVVRSTGWDNGSISNAGAVTWGSATSGVRGAVSASNSLVGSQTNDFVGSTGISALPNGNFIIGSGAFSNGSLVAAGAFTWASGTTGISGTITAANSAIGQRANLGLSFGLTADTFNDNFTVQYYADDRVFVGSLSTGFAPPSNTPPSLVTLTGVVASLPEQPASGTATNVATINVTDDGVGTNQITLAGADAAFFQLSGTILQLKAGVALDFEAKSSYSVTIEIDDPAVGATPDAFVDYVLAVTDVNEQPTSVSLQMLITSFPENTLTTDYVDVAIATIGDDATGDNTLFFRDFDGQYFVARGNLIQLRPGVSFNYEQRSQLHFTVLADDYKLPENGYYDFPSTTLTLNIEDVNEAPTIQLAVGTSTVLENSVLPTMLAVIQVNDDALGNNTLSLSGADAGWFTIVNNQIRPKFGWTPDFETKSSYTVFVNIDDPTVGATPDFSVPYTLTIQDVNEFSVSPPVDLDPRTNVDEQSPVGTPVGITVFAKDADGTNNQVTYSLDDDAGGRFAIDPVSGVVTVANPALLDYEKFPLAYGITARATSQDGSSLAAHYIVGLNDVNEFDVTQPEDWDATLNVVFEDAAAGTTVGITAHAYDGDGSDPPISYSLADSAGGRFQIVPGTGVVSVAPGAVLDRETAASYRIVVRAMSTDGSIADQTFAIQVLDADEFPLGPVSDVDIAPNQVLEGAANGTPVGVTGFAFDPDATATAPTYSLLASANGRFAIDPVSGVVTVARGEWLDREAAAAWSITVKATNPDGSFSTKAFSITLLDVSDTPIGPVTDADPVPNQVLEGAPNGTTVGITGWAVDKDLSNNAISYSLIANANGRFAIDPVTGVVTVAHSEWLDREAAAAWSVTVKATSQDGSSSVKAFTVTLLDAQDTPVGPVSDTNPAGSVINENAPNGTAVGITAFAIDKDLTNNGVTYSLASDAGGRFAIDPVSGVVTVAHSDWLDREAAAAWSITVKATSQDGSSSLKAFSITLNDVNDNPVSAIDDVDPAASVIPETAPNGTAVGITARAVDRDVTNNGVTYSLTNSGNGRFAIDPVTGVVTVARSEWLDYEGAGAPAWSITVKATSQDGSSSQAPYSIQVTAVNEFPVGPVSDVDLVGNQVQENAANGTLVGVTAFANDLDVTGDGVTYSLTDNAGGRFAIDPVSGVVSVANGSLLDYETAATHQITVLATGEDGSSATASFTIAVADVVETPQLVLSNSAIDENPPTGTVVGALSVSNLNLTTPVYTLVTGGGSTDNAKFSISGNQLRTKGPLDFETQRTASIRVQMKDSAGHTVVQVFSIRLRNVNEAPTGLSLSPSSIAENNAVGAVVGTFSGVDPDAGDTFSYTLVSGMGSTDNVKFAIDGNQLKAAASFDYETKRSYTIRVRVTDAAGLSFEKTLTINVTNGPG